MDKSCEYLIKLQTEIEKSLRNDFASINEGND